MSSYVFFIYWCFIFSYKFCFILVFMSIQVSLVQCVLYTQMVLVLFLLQPYFTSFRMWLIRKYNFITKATILKHIIIGLYVMVGIMLLDSSYKWNKSESIILVYQNEKNFYLCVFSLFLAVVLNKLCILLENTFKTELFNKQTGEIIFLNRIQFDKLNLNKFVLLTVVSK